jgi:hypothetical protein
MEVPFPPLQENAMTILQMQEAIMAKGWQFKEHVFNDGNPHNCFIEFTQDKSPFALSDSPKPKDRVGWGRFPRQMAWQMAYGKIIEGNKTE